ncbi:MAG: Superkiller protein 3 [Cirrosporium novae-zelandiae]|nr:MAG: Superkiller protein 3 [Cirrosporium novae-zelandiae]
MSAAKAARAGLKSAKAALDTHDYETAREEAEKVLSLSPNSYHAQIFLGLALEKLNRYNEAEKAYNDAAKLKDGDPLVWYGFISLYENQAGQKLDDYRHAALRLAEILSKEDDKTKCQSVIDKFIKFTKRHGTKLQYAKALEVELPTSSIYEYLEGRIPHPAHTYSRIVEILEANEREHINKEIGERRTRIGAKFDLVTAEVKREVLSSSPLENLYQQIIDWSNDDEQRRQYEEKLFQHAYDSLLVLPQQQKEEKRKQVLDMAQGMVIIKHPFPLAWTITLEWKDGFSLSEWDLDTFYSYMSFFPNDGLTKVLKGYLPCDISPFQDQYKPIEKEDGENNENIPLSLEDRLLLMTEGLEDSDLSTLAHRIIAEFFLDLEEYTSALDAARKAKILVNKSSKCSGLQFQESIDGINITLGNILIAYQSPRNHPEARSIFEEILDRKPDLTPALIGVGLILEECEDYPSAISFLSRAAERDPTNLNIRAEAAWCKALDGQYEQALQELEGCVSEIDGTDRRSKELKAEVLYRTGYCKWNINPSKAGRKDRKEGPYVSFIAALKANSKLAPAYTYLGIYFADYAHDKKRARKCFQQAFDLSPAEVEAAKRLADMFANQGDWDLVEIIAQRVVDSGKVRPAPGSKKKGISWSFAALGVVQLNRQEFSNSIVSFQSALKISPNDYDCWVGLGESYANAGRYIAATKAFNQVLKLEEELDGRTHERAWFARYMLANVHRELGEYDKAIAAYTEVLQTRTGEFGVMISLLQTFVEGAWRNIELGYFGRAVDNALQAVDLAVETGETRIDSFNLWKALGDACTVFSWVQGRVLDFPVGNVCALLEKNVDTKEFDQVLDQDGIGSSTFETLRDTNTTDASFRLEQALQCAVLSFKRAIFTSQYESHAQAVAWFNLGCTEHRAHACLVKTLEGQKKQKRSRFLQAAVRCFKKAIELEASNSEFWDALGVVTTSLNPRVSQNSFVRSLHLNDKSPRVWTNLGTLYLLQNDVELANEAFAHAQSADPDYAHAWLGQGYIALLVGDFKEAHLLFTHAFEISDSSSMVVKSQYALSSFDNLLSDTSAANSLANLLSPLFALHQLHSQTIPLPWHSHLLSLLAERIFNPTVSIASLTATCNTLETAYETTESLTTLTYFAQSTADLARAYLATNDFSSAAENAETALSLSDDPEIKSHYPEAYAKTRLSAHLTAGLASYYLSNTDTSLSMFRQALEESSSSPDVVCLLSQVLWTKGSEPERAVAREQLLDCVEKHPEHVRTVALLGVIAILDGDTDILDAVTDDLRSLRTRDDLTSRQQLRIAKVLSVAVTSAQPQQPQQSTQEAGGEPEPEELSSTTTSVMLSPSQPQGWSVLSSLFSDAVYPAEMAVQTARRAVPPHGSLGPEEMCKAFVQTERMADAQRGIMCAPWAVDGWREMMVVVEG